MYENDSASNWKEEKPKKAYLQAPFGHGLVKGPMRRDIGLLNVNDHASVLEFSKGNYFLPRQSCAKTLLLIPRMKSKACSIDRAPQPGPTTEDRQQICWLKSRTPRF